MKNKQKLILAAVIMSLGLVPNDGKSNDLALHDGLDYLAGKPRLIDVDANEAQRLLYNVGRITDEHTVTDVNCTRTLCYAYTDAGDVVAISKRDHTDIQG